MLVIIILIAAVFGGLYYWANQEPETRANQYCNAQEYNFITIKEAKEKLGEPIKKSSWNYKRTDGQIKIKEYEYEKFNLLFAKDLKTDSWKCIRLDAYEVPYEEFPEELFGLTKDKYAKDNGFTRRSQRTGVADFKALYEDGVMSVVQITYVDNVF